MIKTYRKKKKGENGSAKIFYVGREGGGLRGGEGLAHLIPPLSRERERGN